MTDATNAGIHLHGVAKRFGDNDVLTDVTAHLAPGRIHGLLGANGVGKTTLMSLICDHGFPTGGSIRIDGEDPHENPAIRARTCFVHEDQPYNDAFTVRRLLQVLPEFYPGWDAELAGRLLTSFRLPEKTKAKKLSRGQRSALAIVVGLSSRADYTFLDEPYLGLDPTAREIFYETLVAEQAEHPRTFVMSTHLVDEAADLMEDVLVLDAGRIVLQAELDEARHSAFVVRGLESEVQALIGDRPVLAQRRLGRILSATVRGALTAADHDRAARTHLSLEPATLQELVAAIGLSALDTSRDGRTERKAS